LKVWIFCALGRGVDAFAFPQTKVHVGWLSIGAGRTIPLMVRDRLTTNGTNQQLASMPGEGLSVGTIPFMVRLAHHERNQTLFAPVPVEGLSVGTIPLMVRQAHHERNLVERRTKSTSRSPPDQVRGRF